MRLLNIFRAGKDLWRGAQRQREVLSGSWYEQEDKARFHGQTRTGAGSPDETKQEIRMDVSSADQCFCCGYF